MSELHIPENGVTIHCFWFKDSRVIFFGTFRVLGAKIQFASQDVTAKTDSAGDSYLTRLFLPNKAQLFLKSYDNRSPGECRCRSGFSGPGCQVEPT